MIGYRALLDVPRELVVFVAQLVRVERRARGTRRGTRALTCRQQAAFVLVWFRTQEDLGLLGTGFGISRATASWYRDEAGEVLAAQAPELTAALERVATEGWSHVVLDGTVVASDRCAAKTTSSKGEQIDLWYAGKTHGFGGNVQAVLRPDGLPVWVCGVLPGSVPDLTATRANVLAALSAARRTGTAHPGRRRVRRCRSGCVHPGQTTPRRNTLGDQQPGLPHTPEIPALPGRTWVRPPYTALARPVTRHRLSTQGR